MYEELKSYYEKNGLDRCNLKLFSKDESINLICLCKELMIKVLGYDVFEINENRIIPLSKYTIDNSDNVLSYDDLKKSIESVPNNDYFFEIVLDD